MDNQKESVIGRKALAEKTKGLHPTLISLFHSTQYFPVLEFKKIADEEKLNAFKGLLKGMRQVHDTYMTHSHFGAQPTRRRLTASRSAQRHQTMHSYMSTKSWQKPPTHTLSLRLQWSVPPSYFIQNIFNKPIFRTRLSKSQKPWNMKQSYDDSEKKTRT